MDDPLVRRIGFAAMVICLMTTAAAWIVFGGRMAAGVFGGGFLIGLSFYVLGGGVASVVHAASVGGAGSRGMGIMLAKVVLRYALLGFLAYVMIARLRLHPIGLLVGATSITAAVFVEAVRLHLKRS